jgi:16S rRNA (uracil1498-N3)-methyltransferase
MLCGKDMALLSSRSRTVPDYDYRTQRLYVKDALSLDATIPLTRDASHYLVTVLRYSAGDAMLLFNGQDGEWLASLSQVDRKSAMVTLKRQTRPQPVPVDIDYIFAPIKTGRIDYLVQKAVEMGASRLIPVITRHTQHARLNIERLQANMIEAAEQCGILHVPNLEPERKLDALLAQWPADRTLIFCDERAEIQNAVAALQATAIGPLAVLIGPEGGFSAEEREAILKLPSVTRLSLGPRILRADTAGIAALALVQAILGDGRIT